jgi:enoyl-CoA hydratase/carnithine racemase
VTDRAADLAPSAGANTGAARAAAAGEVSASGFRLDRDGPVATVTLNRPERLNAQTPHTWEALREVGRTLTGDVRVVVIRAEGRAFSAGLDRAAFTPKGIPGALGLAELGGMPRADADREILRFQEAFSWLRRPDLVSIAAVQGYAIGAGCQLALACDLRVLAADAQLSLPEPTLGLVPDLGGTAPLVDAVGYSRALEICLTGRRVGAEEALRLGLATLVVPRDELVAATGDLVAALLATPRDAAVEAKALLLGAAEAGHPRSAQEAAERAAQLRRLRDLAAAAGLAVPDD